MPERIPQSATLRVPLYAVLASDHVSAGTGLTLAITISKNGAAFGNPSAGATNATGIASGWYYVDLSTTDTGTLGPLIVLGSAGTADPVTIAYNVVDATNGGLSNLDAAVTSRLAPTTAGRTLDVSTGGEAGLDWANIGSPTTAVALSATTISSSQVVASVTGAVGSVTGLTAANLDVAVSSRLAPTVAARTLDVSATGEAGVDWGNVGSPTTTVGLTNTTISSTQVVASVSGAVGSVTGNVGGNVVGSVGSVTAAVALTSSERNSVADAILDRNMTTGTDSGSSSVRTVRQALRFLRNKWQITSGTLTVYKEDDSTSSWTSTLTGTPGADPITTSDPA